MMVTKRKVLFGGDDLKWDSDDWTASDDRVRGGKSQSYLTPLAASHYTTARFHGHLDIKTLGGAGFASQRTSASDTGVTWDLSSYDGIDLVLEDGDEKVYTFILKDEISEELYYVEEGGKGPGTAREQATVSWEYDFKMPGSTESTAQEGEETEEKKRRRKKKNKGSEKQKVVSIPWKSLKPTYRGKDKKDAKSIDLRRVRRMSLMMRSFFGTQEGDFELTLKSIEAVTMAEDEDKEKKEGDEVFRMEGRDDDHDDRDDAGSSDSGALGGSMALKAREEKEEKEGLQSRGQRQRDGWLCWLLGKRWKL